MQKLALVFAVFASHSVYAATLSELEAREKALVEEFRSLRQEAPTSRLIKELRRRSSEGDLARFRADWTRWKRFEAKVDAWNRDKREVLADRALNRLAGVASRGELSRLKKFLDEYREFSLADERAWDQHEEFAAYKRFHRLVREISLKHNGKLDPILDENGTQNEFVNGFLNPSFILNHLPILPGLGLARHTGPGQTPLIDQNLRAFRAEARQEGIRTIRVVGQPGDHRKPDPTTVTLYAHNHVHALYDYAALSVLMDRGVGVIGHLGHALQGAAFPLANIIRGVDHIIDVGVSDEVAVEKIVKNARRGKLSAYHVATTAQTTDGAYAIARNSRRLDRFYVRGLQDRGIKVRAVLVTLPSSNRLMTLWRSPYDRTPRELVVDLSETLEDIELRKLHRITSDSHALGHILRFTWFERLDLDRTTFLGAPALKEIVRRLDLYDFPDL